MIQIMIASAAALLPALVLMAEPARAADEFPSVLTCTFRSGQNLTYSGGRFRAAPAKPLSFEIGDIDLERQSAALLTPAGKGQLRVVRAINANHFLEVVAEGFINMTTIYDLDASRGAFPAVHSRHFGLLGQPVVAQYRGFCKAK